MKKLFRALVTTIVATNSLFFMSTPTTLYSLPTLSCQCSVEDVIKGMRCCCLCLQCTANNSITLFDKLDRIQPTLTKLNQNQKKSFVALINLCKNTSYPCSSAEIATLQQLGFLDEYGMLTLDPTDRAAILSLINDPIEKPLIAPQRSDETNLSESSNPSEYAETAEPVDYSLKENASTYTIYRSILPELLTDPETKQILLNFINVIHKKKACTKNEYLLFEELGLATKTNRPWYYTSCLCGNKQPLFTIDLLSKRIRNLVTIIKITAQDEQGIVTDITINDEIINE